MISGGLQRSGDGYIGTGFYLGYRVISSVDGRFYYALQTSTELYEGFYTTKTYINNHVTVSWNKTERQLYLYVDGVQTGIAEKKNRSPERALRHSFLNYINIGSNYDHTANYLRFKIGNLAIWKDSMSSDDVMQWYSYG